jgi:membrane fusion protein, multidrug efflux system
MKPLSQRLAGRTMRKAHQRGLLGVVFFSIAVAGVVAALKGQGADPGESAKPSSVQLQHVPSSLRVVEVAAIQKRMLERKARLPGELQPYLKVDLYPKITGILTWIDVDRGSEVKKGQLLARLGAPELKAQREEAEAKLLSDTITYGNLKNAASSPGVIAPNDLDVAQKTVQADYARVQSFKKMEDYLLIKAPFDGRITERNAHPGALLGPEQAAGPATHPMLRLEQVARLRLMVPVPEPYTGGIRTGHTAKFTVPAYPGEEFTGVISRVAGSMDTKTRTMPVELDVDNRNQRLAPGMFPEVQWEIQRMEATLFVPARSVVTTTEKTFVIRVNHNKAEWVQIRRGESLADMIEVFGDLREGDYVVLRATDELKSGTEVIGKQTK